MTGLERVQALFRGERPDRTPCVPTLHAGLAGLFGVPLGRYFTDAATMAATLIQGYRTFGYDGVQLSLGVTAEAQSLGGRIEQPPDAAPALRERPLAGEPPADALAKLRGIDPLARAPWPLFREALDRVVAAIGSEAFVIVTLRGPLVIAAQLRGIEAFFLDLADAPARAAELLDFATETALRLGRAFRDAGAHALVLGEALASPDFLAPEMYRELVAPRHKLLVGELRRAGWTAVNLHICGDLRPILEDVLATGVNFLDIDHRFPAAEALDLVAGRAVLRGNLDPALVACGDAAAVTAAARELRAAVGDRDGWIYGSGCDLSPGVSAESLRRTCDAFREA